MQEWANTHPPKTRAPAGRAMQRWVVPDEGWVKLNSDGAISKARGKARGGGDVLRDNNDAFLAGARHLLPSIVDPEATEILACKRALQVALETNVQRVHVELDCLQVVQMLNRQARNYSVLGPWIQEVNEMLQGFQEFKVSWTRCSANVAAHKLARVGVGDEFCMVWLKVPRTIF
uniref:RNase H type-1 domain-containing protein n=1 Tax=Hordeum vulgare subsp. vulgare TaxID=112509 RepID=A0A8I6X049_HORVV